MRWMSGGQNCLRLPCLREHHRRQLRRNTSPHSQELSSGRLHLRRSDRTAVHMRRSSLSGPGSARAILGVRRTYTRVTTISMAPARRRGRLAPSRPTQRSQATRAHLEHLVMRSRHKPATAHPGAVRQVLQEVVRMVTISAETLARQVKASVKAAAAGLFAHDRLHRAPRRRKARKRLSRSIFWKRRKAFSCSSTATTKSLPCAEVAKSSDDTAISCGCSIACTSGTRSGNYRCCRRKGWRSMATT